jgi:hypothetical protein
VSESVKGKTLGCFSHKSAVEPNRTNKHTVLGDGPGSGGVATERPIGCEEKTTGSNENPRDCDPL